jgi:hypothetical protein
VASGTAERRDGAGWRHKRRTRSSITSTAVARRLLRTIQSLDAVSRRRRRCTPSGTSRFDVDQQRRQRPVQRGISVTCQRSGVSGSIPRRRPRRGRRGPGPPRGRATGRSRVASSPFVAVVLAATVEFGARADTVDGVRVYYLLDLHRTIVMSVARDDRRPPTVLETARPVSVPLPPPRYRCKAVTGSAERADLSEPGVQLDRTPLRTSRCRCPRPVGSHANETGRPAFRESFRSRAFDRIERHESRSRATSGRCPPSEPLRQRRTSAELV